MAGAERSDGERPSFEERRTRIWGLLEAITGRPHLDPTVQPVWRGQLPLGDAALQAVTLPGIATTVTLAPIVDYPDSIEDSSDEHDPDGNDDVVDTPETVSSNIDEDEEWLETEALPQVQREVCAAAFQPQRVRFNREWFHATRWVQPERRATLVKIVAQHPAIFEPIRLPPARFMHWYESQKCAGIREAMRLRHRTRSRDVKDLPRAIADPAPWELGRDLNKAEKDPETLMELLDVEEGRASEPPTPRRRCVQAAETALLRATLPQVLARLRPGARALARAWVDGWSPEMTAAALCCSARQLAVRESHLRTRLKALLG